MVRSRSNSNRTRGWIAGALAVLQAALILAGHPLHAWMHATGKGHQACGSHVAGGSSPTEATQRGHCCTVGKICQAGEPSVEQLPEEHSPNSSEHFAFEDFHSQHHCWSSDCAFYKGIHQTSLLSGPGTAAFQTEILERMLIPEVSQAENLTFFSLRARGPPSA